MNEIFVVEGMTCSSCAMTVEKALKETSGIRDVSVNLATEKVFVNYDSKRIEFNDIKNIIEKLGYEVTENLDNKESKNSNIWKRFILSLIFTIPLVYIAMGPMIGLPIFELLNPDINPTNYALAQFLLTSPVLIINKSYYLNGFRTLFKRNPNMDSLIAIGTSAAFLYGIYALIKILTGSYYYADELYFESAAVILTLITLGKYLEASSIGRTSEAIKQLINLTPKIAIIIKDKKEIKVNVEDVKVGDIIIVKPGEKIPVDGKVIDGTTSVDESLLTGESMPISKKTGDNVIGASINKNGFIKYEATKVGKDTVIAQIIQLVENAQISKSPIAKIADQISGVFVPVVIVLAILSFLAWYYIGGESLSFSLKIFITVLVIACPCALGLATPTAIIVGTGLGAKQGILIKSGEALELAHKVNTIVFDKTGTITEGKPEVTDVICFDKVRENNLIQLVASAEKASEHPLGDAIILYAEEKNIKLRTVSSFEAIPGEGLKAIVDKNSIAVGNKKLMKEFDISINKTEDIANKLASDGKTPIFIAINNKLSGIIAVSDSLKENSVEVMRHLHNLGIKTIMLTGDNKKTAKAIAKKVKISDVYAEVLPEDKASIVKDLKQNNLLVAMVGDGINDAPALAEANVGIAIGTGTDIAIESADIVLMRNDLSNVPAVLSLSKKTIKTIKENLFWAFLYNVLGIPVAMGLLYIFGGPLLNPMIAAGAMSLSSVSVLLNAIRLKNVKSL